MSIAEKKVDKCKSNKGIEDTKRSTKNKKKKLKVNRNRLNIFLFKVVMICIVLSVAMGVKNHFSKPLVCIDAGHGGSDVGALSNDEKRNEKDDNLKLALAVSKKLKKSGFRVCMTRKNDSYVSLEDRCKIANASKAKSFISLHRNASKHGNGVEVWTCSNPDEDELYLAETILENIVEVGVQNDRGVKSGYIDDPEDDYYVNKYTNMTSCIVELGFLSNGQDNRLYDDNFDDYAQGISDGIYAYMKKVTQIDDIGNN